MGARPWAIALVVGFACLAGPGLLGLPVRASGESPDPGGLDVELTRVWLADPDPVSGDRVRVAADAMNIGDAPASGHDLTFRFYADGVEFDHARVDETLAPGSSFGAAGRWLAPSPGPHRIQVVLEVAGDGDTDPGNNEAFLGVNVGESGLPDLVVTRLGWVPQHPEPGQAVRLQATIENQGGRNAEMFRTRFLVDGVALRGDPLPSTQMNSRSWTGDSFAGRFVMPEGSADVPGPGWSWDGQPHRIRVVADVLGDVPETNEANNAYEEMFPDGYPTSSPPPDLVVDHIDWAPQRPVEGAQVAFRVTVRNGGEGAATSPQEMRLFLDGSELPGLRPMPPALRAGASFVGVFTWSAATLGGHHVEVVEDFGDAVPEANEANNRRATDLEVLAAVPELALLQLQPPAHPVAGVAAVLTARVANVGTAGSGPMEVTFLVDGREVATASMADIPAGLEVVLRISDWTATEGTHMLQARVAMAGASAPGSPHPPSAGVPFSVPPAPAEGPGASLVTMLPGSPVPLQHPTLTATGMSVLTAAVALYHRIHHTDALASATRRKVYHAIRADPGCTVGALARATGLSYKTAQRHVHVLVRADLVAAVTGPQERLFAVGRVQPREQPATVALRTRSVQRLWERLRTGPPAGTRALARELGLAPSTIAEAADRLTESGLAEQRPDGKFVVLHREPPASD